MHLNPYGEDAVRLALSLITDPPPTDDAMVVRCLAYDLVIELPVTKYDRAATAEFLAEWLTVIDATDHDERAARLNDLLRFASAYPRLTNHAEDGWHIHYRDPAQPLASLLRTLISVGTALHLAGRGMHRLGRCAAVGCTTPYADFSRTGKQTYCSPACGNRDAVRRHRARTAAGS
ncbi:CGNR zinc finger domain-containing protein [Paractinoplanes lichenicola]|uniref:CGNR zinc finger domain-containing protein n=1 Tax=Paractinoplanes lichenicola TaxID=2802976 RepID=A0ABS1VXZ2_9ACTN|nr:CGNR zinc finger domain-containing protein [Actinoplanes lichenicola]MBL7259369.1 CGNR zinc finger domain-containing protein [Actinoplanes lichenicola]